jgi:hypothetical protein
MSADLRPVPGADPIADLPESLPAVSGPVDGWIVPPHTAARRTRGRGSEGRTGAVTQLLVDRVEQFCTYLRKQRGRTAGGVQTYRWNLEQFLNFVRIRPCPSPKPRPVAKAIDLRP